MIAFTHFTSFYMVCTLSGGSHMLNFLGHPTNDTNNSSFLCVCISSIVGLLSINRHDFYSPSEAYSF